MMLYHIYLMLKPVCLSVCLSICLSIYIYIYVSITCVSVYLSVCSQEIEGLFKALDEEGRIPKGTVVPHVYYSFLQLFRIIPYPGCLHTSRDVT